MRISCAAILLVIVFCFIAEAAEVSYVFPVQPVKSASFKKGGHSYPGIDIFAKKGTAFVSPISGTIEDIQETDLWEKTRDPAMKGGIWISVAGDDGYRYYGSHLDGIAAGMAVGKKVKPGEVLGYIGTSGNAKHTPSHLHFGISLVSRPYTYLVRRGEIESYFFLACLRSDRCDPRKALDDAARKVGSR